MNDKEKCLAEIQEILDKYKMILTVDFVRDKVLNESVLIYKILIVEKPE